MKLNKQITSLNINNQIHNPKTISEAINKFFSTIAKDNPKTIAEAFNKFFSTIAKDIDNKIIPTKEAHKDYLNVSVVNSLFLNPTNEEVESLKNEMNTTKSVGPYSILTNILKLSSSVLLDLGGNWIYH